jgi:hypothetical protein
MKNTIATASPEAYLDSLAGWQRLQVQALRAAVLEAVPALQATIKWGHLVYQANGPVLLIRAEAHRVLFGFWRGQRLRGVEPRLKPGGQYEMATLALLEDTPLERATVQQLARGAVALNAALGDPTKVSR